MNHVKHTSGNSFTTPTAVVLLQMGGPTSLSEVESFLFNLFSDPDIFDFPGAFLWRKYLASFIAQKRSERVRKNYKAIGGKSPITEITYQQAVKLEQQLSAVCKNIRTFVAMRYSHPTIEEVVQELQTLSFRQVVLLPLYPHFSRATTLSSFHEWNRQVQKQQLHIPTRRICCYPVHPLYIDAFVETINATLASVSVPHSNLTLLFSAHGLPERSVEQGDPYQLHVEATVKAILAAGNWDIPHLLCYQSKVGPLRWLQPSLLETIDTFLKVGRRHFLVVPVSFVSEHIETLYELDIEVRQYALERGAQTFVRVPALNFHPSFLSCLTDLVLSSLLKDSSPHTCQLLWQLSPFRPVPSLCTQSKREKI